MKTKIGLKECESIVYITLHAKEIFHQLRWPDGIVCPYCGERHIWHYKNGRYKCSHCHKTFSDTSNTVFNSTKVPLVYWIIAMYLLSMAKGISSEELAGFLKVTQKTTWYILHKLRMKMNQDGTLLNGDIAVDEVYLRGKWSSIIVPKKIEFMKRKGLYYPDDSKRTWSKHNICRAISEYKQPVFGMNDGNKIVLRALPNRFDSKDLIELVEQYGQNISHIISDQSNLYTDMIGKFDVVQMNHSKREFHNGEFSSNRIEGTFSHVKRRVRCHYVRPDKKYMQLYLNEFAFRWNNRDEQTLSRLANIMRLCCAGGRVTYKDIDKYTWTESFHQRPNKHYESIDDWLDKPWPSFAQSMEIHGVTYTKDDYNRLSLLREWNQDKVGDQVIIVCNYQLYQGGSHRFALWRFVIITIISQINIKRNKN